jgi:hypothetical protein
MATTVSTLAPATAAEGHAGEARSTSDVTGILHWPIYAVVVSAAFIVTGLLWDISWHRTIGRDTFWSPPHVLEQIAAVVAGLTCAYLVLRTTFGGSTESRAVSVRFWRVFQAPLGAWVCIWGTIMMITSAPFDDWWHNAYGLDVKILSPPHMVLAGGMIGIQVGAMLMVLGAQNRATREGDRHRYALIFAVAAAILLVMSTVLIQEEAAFGNQMHGSSFYKMTAIVLPIFLVAFGRALRLKWPATTAALLYMAMVLVTMWVTQLFPAQAKLAPIYNPVTHMVPTPFPLLLVFPALAIDILLRRFGEDRDWTLALAIGAAFVAVMLVVHWFWAEFLLSPWARNFVFGVDNWDYSMRLGPWRYRYWNLDRGRLQLAWGLLLAALYAAISARIGLFWGRGMSRVMR